MGTNYYALAPECPNPCGHCDAQTEWHIGKSLTMFEAHEVSPWGRIADWSDWKRILLPGTVRIRDEYNRDHEPAEFIANVEATHPEDRRRQYQWMVDHGHAMDRDYLDDWGFSWHRGEFS